MPYAYIQYKYCELLRYYKKKADNKGYADINSLAKYLSDVDSDLSVDNSPGGGGGGGVLGYKLAHQKGGVLGSGTAQKGGS